MEKLLRHKYSFTAHNKLGFTIVELLIVVVVIAILAAITIVSYNGISRSAQISVLKSDLRSASNKLTLHKTATGDAYPASLNGVAAASANAKLEYTRISNTSFCLTAISLKIEGVAFYTTESGSIEEGYCSGHEPSTVTKESCFAFNSATRTITGYFSNEDDNASNPACPRDVEIPDTIAGLNVTGIGNNAFSSRSLSSVTMPGTIITIGSSAFLGNSIVSIDIPNTVTSIGANAFSWNNLASVVIPNSVTTLGAQSFLNNDITSLTLSDSLTSIESTTFQDNEISSLVIPSSVKTIKTNAFYNNKITSLTIPSTLTTLGQGAFSSNLLTSISIPNSVTTIGSGVFSFNKITSFTIPSSWTTIPNAILSNNKLTSLVIPEGVTTIENNAFSGNNLTSVSFPSTIANIDTGAFGPWQDISPVLLPHATIVHPDAFSPYITIERY